ncbi:MAG: methyl-viologen-reducing hydrogenase subunit delta, partial [Lysobacterales bacterium CG_4_9_14_3_um_filter_62_6]
RNFEHGWHRITVAPSEPLEHLGAIAGLLLLLLLATGSYLFVVFDTSVSGAWQSIDQLARTGTFPGGWLRSLHRYAADGLLLVTLLHLLREFMLGRYTHFRRATWWTGVPLLLLVYLSAIGGFWLNWDQLGQYSALASAELIDALPLLGATLTRNFVAVHAVSDRLFSLLIFIHLGVPLLLLFGLWFHLQRIHLPQVLPPRALTVGVIATLGLLAAAAPIASQAPADLARVPTALHYDWILLHLHPLAEAFSPATVWLLIATVLLVLLLLPLRHGVVAPVAVVDADFCNGCRRCVDDCPYSAITLVAHPNAKAGRQLAVVAASRCAGCGICAGACPSAMPFRRVATLATGIDLPQRRIGALRQRLRQALVPGSHKIVVFGCDHGAAVAALTAADVVSFSLLCSAQLPPSFIDYALRIGALGVVISSCTEGACEFRLGARWTSQRLGATREPRLRTHGPAPHYQLVFADGGDEPALVAAIAGLRQRATMRALP